MSAILSELKIVLVIAGVLATTLAAAKWKAATDSPAYLPPSDPCLYGRVCAAGGTGPTAEPAAQPIIPAAEAAPEAIEDHP